MSLQHILKNSSVSGKEPLASQLANGELSINYHADGPFLCCKDTAGNVRRVAGVWVATTAPSTPFPGELWLDTSITPSQLRVYKDTTDHWVYAGEVNPASTAYAGIVQLATNGETQAGTNATSAVTPAGLQSKISDSTTTVSSTTIASSTAVKSVGDLASAALPKSGGTITGTLEIGNTGQIRFEGSSDDAYETTLAVEDPTAPRTITLPDRSGTVITTGDTGTVTNTMLAGSIADSKLSTITTADKVSLSALNIDGATDIGGALSDADLFIVDDGANGTNRKAPATRISDYAFGKVNGAVTIANNGTSSLGTGVIVNSNVSNTAAIAGTKVSPDFGSQNITTTGSLGIGTSSPSSLLHLAASSGTIQTQFNNGGTSSFIGHDSAYTGLDIAGGGGIKFRYFNGAVFAEAARFDTTGRLGIGTSSPGRILQVTSTPDTTNPSNGADFIIANPGLTPTEINSTTAGLGFAGLGVNYAGDYHFRSFWGFSIDKGAGNLNSGASNSVNADSRTFAIRQYAGGTTWNTQFCVNGSGNVGIGTSSPGATVDVSSTTGARIRSSFTNNSGGRDAGFEIYGDISGTFDVRSSLIYAGNSGVTSLTSALDLAINTNNSERLRIDSFGNVGIGTSSPNRALEVNAQNGSNTTSVPALRLKTGNIAGAAGYGTGIDFTVQASNNVEFVSARIESTYTDITNQFGDVRISTMNAGSFSEKMRINNDGGILQTSSNNAGFTVDNNSTGNVGTLIGVNTATTAGTGFNFILCWSSSFTSERFKVQGNGDTRNANNVFGGISDIKLKENIVSSGSQWNDLKALQVRKYNFKEGETHTQIGLIAQEVEIVSPGLVAETPDRDKDGNDLGTTTKSVNYSVLYMKAVKALQEAMERIETLEAKVAALEAA